MAGAVDALLRQTAVSTSVDISALLSSEYDEDEESPFLDTSADLSFSDASGLTPAADRSNPGLQGALAARGLELSEMEREQRRERMRDSDTLRQLREENEVLRRAAANAEARASNELKLYRDKVEAAHARSRAELTELRAKLGALQTEVPGARHKLSTSKADFAQLTIDTAQYEALRRRNPEDVSVVEHVQMRVYDLVQAAERKALASGGGVGFGAASTGSATPADQAAREALQMKLVEAQARAQQKSAEAEEFKAEAKALRAEAARAAATPEAIVRGKLQVAEEKLAALLASSAEKDAKLAELKAEHARSSRSAEESASQVSYLTQDKEYLKVQVKALEERLATSESRLAKEETEILDLKSELSRAREQQSASAKEHAEEYANKLQLELQRWQMTTKVAHDATVDAHLAAVNTHKDSRELALADADKWHARYNELKREHDATMLAAAEAAGKAEIRVAELRAENKLKVFEAERMRMQCEQAFVSARQAQVDADARAEKLEVLKSEYYALKTSSATTIAQLQASHGAMQEKVATYERLEEELDSAVVQSGTLAAYSADEAGGSGSATGGEEPTGPHSGGGALQSIIRVPSSAQRRMQQCLGLAKDLLHAQRRAEQAEAALLEQKAEVERMNGVVHELNRKVRLSGQPHNVLAQQVEAAEAKRGEAEAEAQRLGVELAKSQETLSATRVQNEQLLKDMESLLSQRGSLEALRATLTRLLPPEFAPALVPSAA